MNLVCRNSPRTLAASAVKLFFAAEVAKDRKAKERIEVEMRILTYLSLLALLITLTGCGPSKSEQAKSQALEEIKKSNADYGEAIHARFDQLGKAAALLKNPTVTGKVPADTHFEIYPEFFSAGLSDAMTKTTAPSETVTLAVVNWNHLDTYNTDGVKNEPADHLTFLNRPLGFYYDIKKVRDALTDPSVFDDADNYRRLRELALSTRYVLALQQLDFQSGSLEAGSGANVFTPGHVAFRAVLIDLDGPAVLAIGEGEATNSDEIHTQYRYKDDGSNAKDEAARKAAEDQLREDLRKNAYAALQQSLQAMVAGPGTSTEQQLGPDGKLHDVLPDDSKLDEAPGDVPIDSKLSDPFPGDPSPDTKVP